MRLTLALYALFAACQASAGTSIAGSHVDEERGFAMRDFELRPPFHNLYSAWDISGDAVMINNRISLTRDIKSMRGALWSKNRVQERDWEAQASIRIYGSSGSWHAEGMAFWYTASSSVGHVFGAGDQFSGIGVLLDTYKNNVNNHETFPRLTLVLNDGTKNLDWDKDGANLQIGSCHVTGGAQSPDSDVRSNKVMRVLVRYYMEKIEVFYARYDESTWTQCITADQVRLPVNYLFGMSASTGDLTNNHEVVTFKVSALDAPPHSSFAAVTPEQKTTQQQTVSEPSSEGWGWGMKFLFFILFLLFCGGGFYFYKAVWQPKVHMKKRFY